MLVVEVPTPAPLISPRITSLLIANGESPPVLFTISPTMSISSVVALPRLTASARSTAPLSFVIVP